MYNNYFAFMKFNLHVHVKFERIKLIQEKKMSVGPLRKQKFTSVGSKGCSVHGLYLH